MHTLLPHFHLPPPGPPNKWVPHPDPKKAIVTLSCVEPHNPTFCCYCGSLGGSNL